jgi:Domain of unknown function (DUF4062)
LTAFPHRRLQVFVSSTYEDLKPERQAAVEAILTAGHIPAGMELFTAGDETQLDVIKHWIDASDVFLLILGGRYGSIEPTTQKSYIHLEYDHALAQGKRLFACVADEKALDERAKQHGLAVVERHHSEALQIFRTQVLSKISRTWHDFKDIKITISETLASIARDSSLCGWVRADQSANIPAMADEITRLSRENAELREEIGRLEGRGEPKEITDNLGLLDALSVTVFQAELAGGARHQVSLMTIFQDAGPHYIEMLNSRLPLRFGPSRQLGVAAESVTLPESEIIREFMKFGLFRAGSNDGFIQLTEKGLELLRGLSIIESRQKVPKS